MPCRLPLALFKVVSPLLERHEGKKFKPYEDTVGKLTIGIGRNLTDRGLSESEVLYLFNNDLDIAYADARRWLGDTFDKLTVRRQAVVVDMAFNMGYNTLSQFRNTCNAIKLGKYVDASNGMLSSKWASQVGYRAVVLAQMMREG